jgi:phosphatidylglycerophosphatase C
MTTTVVFDQDKVLLSGNATRLFLHGRLRLAPARLLPLLAAAPVLLLVAAVSALRPLAARLLVRVAVGGGEDDVGGGEDDVGGGEDDVAAVAAAFREALSRKPEAAVGDAIACLRRHRQDGDRVVVATGCEETLARGFLTAVGLGDVDVVGSTGSLHPLRVRRAIGETKLHLLVEHGFPPPWTAVYSDSPSDLPLFAGTARPVLVNAGERVACEVARVLGRAPETRTWR